MPDQVVSTVNDEHEGDSRDVAVVVAPAETLSMDEVRSVVGAKNVMGTCSG